MNEHAKSQKKTLMTLFSVILLDVIGFAILMPILPEYLPKFLSPEQIAHKGLIWGLLMSSYAAMQFIFSPIWGRLSDRHGRKKILMITIAGLGLSFIMLSLAQTLLQIFAARLLGGIFAANIGLASAMISDVTDEKDRTKSMGLIGASFGIGFILGPALGGILAKTNLLYPIYATAIFSILNFVWASFALHEPSKHKDTEKLTWKELLSQPKLFKFCLANFFFTASVTQLESTFIYYMNDDFGFDISQTAYTLASMAFLMALIQGGLIRPLSKRFSDQALLLSGGLFLSLGFVSIPFVAKFAILLISLSVLTLGRGLAQPALSGMTSKSFALTRIGAVMGIFMASASLSRAISPWIAGWAYDLSHAYPFYLGAIFMLLSVAVILLGKKNDAVSV